jgi:hypothetical protein
MKNVFRLLSILFLVSCVGFVSCKKENDIFENNATVIWYGDYARDGCGFFIKMDGKKYKAQNESVIDESYKNNDVRVKIKYKLLNKQIEYYCGLSFTPMKNVGEVEIISIKKK